jgi:phenylalanyl-tRNA synthetase alpha subunit
MKITKIKTVIIFLVLLPWLTLVGCQPSVQEAEQTVEKSENETCMKLAELGNSLATLVTVTPDSTVEEVKKAQEEVGKSIAELKASLKEVDKAKSQVLEAANAELEQTIKTLPEKDTLAEAAATIQPQVQAVEEARAQLSSEVECLPTP